MAENKETEDSKPISGHKEPISSLAWIIQNIVHEVDPAKRTVVLIKDVYAEYTRCLGTDSHGKFSAKMMGIFGEWHINKRIRHVGQKVTINGFLDLYVKGTAHHLNKKRITLHDIIIHVCIVPLLHNYFIYEPSEQQLSLGLFTDCSTNGNKIIKSIVLSASGHVTYWIGEKQLSAIQIELPECIVMHEGVLNNLLFVFKEIKLCCGIAMDSDGDPEPSRYRLVESLRIAGSDKPQLVTRSPTCFRFINFASNAFKYDGTCARCTELRRVSDYKARKRAADEALNEDESEDEEEEQPTDPEELMSWLCAKAGLSTDMTLFFKQQVANYNQTDPRLRRWDKSLMNLCLTVRYSSRRAYRELKTSGFMVLPSEKTLSIYKRNLKQKEGITPEIMNWLVSEANSKESPSKKRRDDLDVDEVDEQNTTENNSAAPEAEQNLTENNCTAPEAEQKKPTQFPCGVCQEECDHDAIQCDICKIWNHFCCVQINAESVPSADWYCENCC